VAAHFTGRPGLSELDSWLDAKEAIQSDFDEGMAFEWRCRMSTNRWRIVRVTQVTCGSLVEVRDVTMMENLLLAYESSDFDAEYEVMRC